MKVIDKNELGLITNSVRILFKALKYPTFMYVLSRVNDKYRSRGELNLEDIANKEYAANRILRIDIYILFWVLLEIFFIILISNACTMSNIFVYILVALSTIRLVEIFQVNINTMIFDNIQRKSEAVASKERMIVLAAINYIEALILFGIIYAANSNLLKSDTNQPIDGLYLSAMTQFTIGFGDVSPIGWLRGVVAIQGFYSSVFIILVFSRLLSMFSKITALYDETP
ncbi:ion channel [Methylobacterium sp. 88A]|uniref:ion channel n=1 Tax=Methylobacterium sp. 88A TaxID=1131813 RepID=UPI0009D96A15|nr:ion channel [Methylobacterium sp. 88A]